MFDEWILRSRRVVTGGAINPADVVIRRGVIAAVAPHGGGPAGPPVIDVGELAVLPGVVDTHVHVNEPGRTEWEGFATATRAAAAGGVTSLVDMPLNSVPATTTVRALEAKRAAMDGKLTIDVGLWGGAVPGNAGELVPLLRAGALGFKCFLVDSGVDEFPRLDADGLAQALAAIAGTAAPLLVHAELPGPLAAADAALAASALRDPRSYLRYLRSRPPEAEDEAVALVATTAAATGGRAHIVHLSSAGSLDTLRRARDQGVRLSAETTPHYLVFAAEGVPDGATPYKCAPPIREEANRDRLWGGLADGTVEMVVTDHSPCTPELKRLAEGDFAAAWGGIASLELGLAAVWTAASARGFDLAQVVDWLCRRPAALAGLTAKGELAPGRDADLIVLDPDATFVVDPARLHHRHPVTPYAGAALRGVVAATILGGQPIYAGAAAPWAGPPGFVGAPRGRWLRGTAA